MAEVPGTRDIILSPYKPQIKNVTAEDVATSLYYVHLDTPEDDLLIANSPRDVLPRRSSLESSRSAINRKPLAAVPPGPSNLGKASEPLMRTPDVPAGASVGRDDPSFAAPAPQSFPHHGPPVPIAQGPPPPPIHRKPLAPKGMAVDTQVQPPTPPPHEFFDVSKLPPKPSEIDNHPEYGIPPLPPRQDLRSPSPSKRKPFTPFSLTLIRRDRSSQQQWNVGKIASFQLDHPEQIPDEKLIPSPSISIHLETPGYAKFRGMPPPGTAFDIRDIRESLDIIRPGSSSASPPKFQSPPRPRPAKPVDITNTHTSPTSGAIFERQVKMAYGPSWTTNIRNAFKRPRSREGDLPVSPGRPGHERQTSNISIGSFGGDFDGGEPPVITMPSQGLKAQGYMFFSPWDGRCEFRTGNGGRSLRCRHILPTHTSQWNPLADGLDEDITGAKGHKRHGSRSPKVKGNDISELRFNLPSAELFNNKPSDSDRPHEARERTRDRILNSMINKTEDDLEDEEYESVGFDMSLGREKAGGGNRGKRAKMGKLIIWDEGLKMLDLVVAANIGIWWNVWERKMN
ncbi:hypothetical protein PFICI_02236 [Pestalotiopsis fici W106-1]|uniref:Uncharacterized protein n=1 Tax=Pestalotiopsis fici (strain W106-1 / CGMCC3.15140) TaxID=1229662 RepID=W3XG83_PESFW|nr:uncharacterized protein PFICI_02236 [Pestalotiopsis fici W106-1]ETS84211.1 hypothetical protein PFICI_02236 [Pestalotiopsis fici W106-1]